MLKKNEDMYDLVRQNTGVSQTDRQTSCHGIVCAMHKLRAVKGIWLNVRLGPD